MEAPTTTEVPTTVNVQRTTEAPTTSNVQTTTVTPTATDAPSTPEARSTANVPTTTEAQTTAYVPTTTVYPTITEASTTDNVSTTAEAPITTNAPTTAYVQTTTEYPTTAYIPTITEYPTTANVKTTTGYPNTANVPTTSEVPTTVYIPTITEYPTTANVQTTTAYQTTAYVPTTSEAPTGAYVPTTTEYPTTAYIPTPTEYPTTAYIPTTTEYPTIANVKTTTGYPTTAYVRTTSEAPITAYVQTTIDAPTTVNVPKTTDAPTTAYVQTTTDDPTTAYIPTTTDALTTAYVPTTTEAPTTAYVPTTTDAQTPTEAPITAYEPTTTEAQTTSEAPIAANSPITANVSTIMVDRTTTEIPTTAYVSTTTEVFTRTLFASTPDAVYSTERTTNQPTTSEVPVVHCGILMTYGTAAGDQASPASDDTCRVVINLDYRVQFLGVAYRKIYICPNGLICFKQPFSGYFPPSKSRGFSVDFKDAFCIAAYFTDLEVTSNQLYYQSYDFTTNSYTRVSAQLAGLVNETDFEPVFAVKVTWVGATRFQRSDAVTFQVVFTTNETHSYSFHSYLNGGMLDSIGSPFIGYIADGHYEGLDNTPDGSYLRRPDRNLKLNERCKGAVSFDYSSKTKLDDDDRLTCKVWYRKEKSKASFYETIARSMPDCPCFLNWLLWDRSFSLWDLIWYSSNIIHVPMEPTRRSSPFGKSCAYDLETWSFIGFGQEAGTFASVNPLINSRRHKLDDLNFRTLCCERTDLCNLYFKVRPLISNCYSRFPFSLLARGVGDPHINTLDGANYTFNGHGEYVMMKIISENANLEIQCRTQRAKKATGDLSDATVFSGFAIKGDEVWMQVELHDSGNRTQLFVGTNKSSWVDYTNDLYKPETMVIKSVPGLTVSRNMSEKTIAALLQ
ncbi:hypothetical protein DPMN_112704 [Dreissena polymorpha]|uniref:Uncharacterized protein n=1 Tax=Dreissena polymorpha TaxID=45954 RepID=A0A9D4QQ95_DREPO|nr:hypothetical protein DPMN_112704 [Dreissena polymorpha]